MDPIKNCTCLLRLRIVSEQSAVWLMFQNVVGEFRHRILTRCFGEVDRPVCGDVQVIQASEGTAINLRAQHSDLSRSFDRQQSHGRIGHDEIACLIEGESEWSPCGVAIHTRLSSIWLELDDASVFEARVDSTCG